jgi:Skp family chaperone for outer membrane proteins
MNGMSGVIQQMNNQITNLTTLVNDNMAATNPAASADIKAATEELKATLTKVQVDIVNKHNELKKDIEKIRKEDIQKELSKEMIMLETTLVHKMDQSINKAFTERSDRLLTEMKVYVDDVIASLADDDVGVPAEPSTLLVDA